MSIASPKVPSDTAPVRAARLLALAAALAAAGYAQTLADTRQRLLGALLLYLGAAALFAFGTWRRPAPLAAPASLPLRIDRRLLGWAVFFAALAFASLGGNHFTLQGMIPWVLAVVLCFAASPGHRAPAQGASVAARPSSQRRWVLSWRGLALLGAIIAGAWLRLYRLAELPADLGWDLPYNYADVQGILRGEHAVFFPANMGREGLFFYLAATAARVGRLSPYAIRITSALVGVAAIPAAYLLARECLDGEAGLYAAWLMAFSKWHLVLSRSGYRVSLMPLLATLALYALARALRRGSARAWCWCGFFTGLGLWSYKAFVFVLPVALACVAFYALVGWPGRRAGEPSSRARRVFARGLAHELLPGAALWLLIAVITAVPLLRFAVDEPNVYLTRELHAEKLVSASADDGSRWQMLGENAITSLLMFNYVGDGNSRFGVPFQRHLGFIGGILFVFGVAGALAAPRRDGHALLLIALAGLLAPMTVSMVAGEMPNSFRSSGVLGPATVVGALALRRLRALLSERAAGLRGHGVWRLLVAAAVALALLGEGRETERFYFVDYRDYAPDRGNYSIALEISRTMVGYQGGPRYVVIWPHWFDGRALSVHLDAAGQAPALEVEGLRTGQLPLSALPGMGLFVLHPDDAASLQALEGYYPRHVSIVQPFPGGEPAFIAFYGAW